MLYEADLKGMGQQCLSSNLKHLGAIKIVTSEVNLKGRHAGQARFKTLKE